MTPSTRPQTSAGRIDLEGDFATLHFERDFPQTPEQVWAALTSPEQLAQWFMTEARIDGRPGGTVELIAGTSRFHATGRILEWDPPHAFEYEWNVEPRAELPQGERAVVRWELSARGDATHMVLRHSRLTRPTALGFAPGMHAFLDRLAAQLAHGPLPGWMERYAEVKDAYPAWTPQG